MHSNAQLYKMRRKMFGTSNFGAKFGTKLIGLGPKNERIHIFLQRSEFESMCREVNLVCSPVPNFVYQV